MHSRHPIFFCVRFEKIGFTTKAPSSQARRGRFTTEAQRLTARLFGSVPEVRGASAHDNEKFAHSCDPSHRY